MNMPTDPAAVALGRTESRRDSGQVIGIRQDILRKLLCILMQFAEKSTMKMCTRMTPESAIWMKGFCMYTGKAMLCQNCKYFAEFSEPYIREGEFTKYSGVCCKKNDGKVSVHMIMESGYTGCSDWKEKIYRRPVLYWKVPDAQLHIRNIPRSIMRGSLYIKKYYWKTVWYVL